MINLIPPEGHKVVSREYWVGVLSVWAFLISGVCIVIAVLLAPLYVLIHSQLVALSAEVRKEGEADISFKEAEKTVIETNKIVSQLHITSSRTNPTEVLTAVTEAADQAIILNKFSVTETDDVISSVQVTGSATSREALTDFKSALERSALFTSAEVPISDLARESDLPFDITVTLSDVKK